MNRMLVPAALGLIAILSICFYEGFAMKDRWGAAGMTAEQLSSRFDNVPLNIGSWQGEDLPVDEITRKTAGAIGYVSRRYINSQTGQHCVLWLIVGHSRDVVRHLPTVCSPSSGLRQIGGEILHHMKADDGKPAIFYTAKFEKEDESSRRVERVFWTFNHPEVGQWEAPDGAYGARSRYGLARALYKLYFTSPVSPDEDTIEANAAVEFAEEMLPAIDAALFPTSTDGNNASAGGDAAAAGPLDEEPVDELGAEAELLE
jgi:hypothetical protein